MAHKVVAQLLATGLIETGPGVGTVVAVLPEAAAKERARLLGNESMAVCPGTPVTFHTPRPYQNSRAELEIDGIRLADYVPRPIGAQ